MGCKLDRAVSRGCAVFTVGHSLQRLHVIFTTLLTWTGYFVALRPVPTGHEKNEGKL